MEAHNRDDETGTTFYPYINDEAGVAGYRCVRDDGRVEYIYLCPSSGPASPAEDEIYYPNVFLYIGPEGLPWSDGAAHYYDLMDEEA